MPGRMSLEEIDRLLESLGAGDREPVRIEDWSDEVVAQARPYRQWDDSDDEPYLDVVVDDADDGVDQEQDRDDTGPIFLLEDAPQRRGTSAPVVADNREVLDDDGFEGGQTDTAARQLRSPRIRRRQPNLARPAFAAARPSDLPPLRIPNGYRIDHRGTLRRPDGRAVPSCRSYCIDDRWPYGRTRPIVVPEAETWLHPELAWCRFGGDLTTIEITLNGRTTSMYGYEVPVGEWVDRCDWPLGFTAPEFAPEALLRFDDVISHLTRYGGKVSTSTLRAYLARGRLPRPQFTMNGRPLWTAPVILDWIRTRPRLG